MARPTTPDPVTLEVIRNKLDDIADEMEITLLKSSHSAIVKEGLDASAALFNPRGEQLAQASAAPPIHLGMIIPAVQTFIDRFPPPEMREGDVYVLNDPFEGGTHLPDLVMSVPILVDAEVVGIATVITHHQEFGGATPGSTPMSATEIFQEGLRVPPMRLCDAGRPNESLLKLIEKNVRVPEVVLGDIHGQLAACETGRRRVVELVRRYGSAAFARYTDELLNRAERLARAALRRSPQGTVEFSDHLDNDGVTLDKRVTIQVSVTIRDSELDVDLAGSDPQVKGPLNCVPASTLAAIYYVAKVLILDPVVPNNAGCYRCVRVTLPPRSVVNAQAPSAVNARGVVVRRIVDAMMGALARLAPERVGAASGGHPLSMTMGGFDPLSRRFYVTAEIGAGGMGGRPGKDGVEAIQTDTTNSQNIPVEALEIEFPIRVGHYRLRRNSGGPGEYRGGLGLEKRLEVLRGEMHVSHRGERHYTPPWGLFGGEPGSCSMSVLTRADGTEAQIPSKQDFVMREGDRLDLWTTGGGGYGDPLRRSPARVLEDVLDEKIDVLVAEARYGVVVADSRVDSRATALLRDRLARERGPITWTYDRGPLGRH